ncbi:CrcB protein [Lentibacillus halodurans]|uniref:Fluoride-specific ion channel FluC n=1 Tax=Lentibacillus halodurans TaxID=237679 RepID=A0A1I0X4B6_9BACI|nr:fluoride efflux transporter CrcB [Lentibacillus halodurans]SFA94893.1 CrcB protein [Lentibacillus halodurans]
MIWLIGLGGSLGAASRYLIAEWMKHKTRAFPAGTWIVNIAGSFLLGMLADFHLANDMNDALWLLLGAGFCGSFTTFSTFGHETVTLLQSDQYKTAGLYVVASIAVGLAAATVGFWI